MPGESPDSRQEASDFKKGFDRTLGGCSALIMIPIALIVIARGCEKFDENFRPKRSADAIQSR